MVFIFWGRLNKQKSDTKLNDGESVKHELKSQTPSEFQCRILVFIWLECNQRLLCKLYKNEFTCVFCCLKDLLSFSAKELLVYSHVKGEHSNPPTAGTGEHSWDSCAGQGSTTRSCPNPAAWAGGERFCYSPPRFPHLKCCRSWILERLWLCYFLYLDEFRWGCLAM